MARSVPELYALASGVPCTGPFACFYCAAPCDDSRPTSTYVKESFNSRTTVRVPGSPWVCAGCVIAMDERADITLIDGEKREGQKTRMYSWVITATSAIAATKAHLHLLRPIFLDPPEPPFALVLTDSGQKQLIFRGRVNRSRTQVVCTLEEQFITYRPADLAARLALVGPLVAATGKPALSGPINTRFGMAVVERYPTAGEQLLTAWEKCREEPLSALARWLAPNKETCDGEYPAEPGPPGVPPEDRRPAGPGDAARRGGGRRDAGAGKQAGLFDGPALR
jgi:CRISPR type IV-associated protein Csf1